MASNHTKASPYYNTPLASAPGGRYLGILKPRIIPPHDTDILYAIPAKFENRPDLLANHFYKNPEYWWVFMMMNPDGIIDPMTDMTEGKVIRVASSERIIGGLA